LIQDPVAITAWLAALVALVFQLERRERLRPLFERLPALVWAYFLPMLSTTAGVLPADSPVYGQLARHLLLPCLVLLLLSSELRTVARLGRTALVVMAAGAAGVTLGALIAYGLLRPWLPPDAWKVTSALAATWIGGSANLVAVATALETPAALQGVAIVVDTVVGYAWMGVLIWMAGRQRAIDHRLGADRGAIEAVAARMRERRAGEPHPPSVADLTLMVGLALGLSALCLQAGTALPPVGRVLGAFSWAVVLLTTLALLLSLTPLARLERAGASRLGYAGFYLLLASVGAQADLRQVAAQPLFVLLGLIVIATHAALLFATVRLLRAPVFFLGAASQACIGGYSSAPIVAAIYEPQMAPVGLLLAVLGNVAGTYAGLAVAHALSSLG
jgi:uncharacterized membrane protein